MSSGLSHVVREAGLPPPAAGSTPWDDRPRFAYLFTTRAAPVRAVPSNAAVSVRVRVWAWPRVFISAGRVRARAAGAGGDYM